MKRILLVSALMAIGTASFAQKSTLNKVKMMLDEAMADKKAIKYDKIDDAWQQIQSCMQDPVTSVMGETYYTAGRIQAAYMTKMLNDRSTTGQMDMSKFFDNQYTLVDLFSKANKCDNTPDAKGKLKKAEEIEKNRLMYQQIASGPRSNLVIAASNLATTDPERCVKFVTRFDETFDEPLFAGVNNPSLDTLRIDAYYFLATAKKSLAKTSADTTALIPILEKALGSKTYGVMACSDLMTIYKQRDQMDKWLEIAEKGMAIDPGQKFFPKVLLEYYMNKHQWDKMLGMCDILKERFPDDDFAQYSKGVMYFQQNKFTDAVKAFKEAAEITGTNAEAWSSAGTSTWKLAMDNRNKVDVCTNYINEAIGYFKKAEEFAPDTPRLWGYFLYQAYTTLKKPAEAAKYKSYKDM